MEADSVTKSMNINSIDSPPPSLPLELIQKVIFSVADALKNGGWKWVPRHESRDALIVLLKSSRSLKEYGEKQLYQNLFITSPETLKALSQFQDGDRRFDYVEELELLLYASFEYRATPNDYLHLNQLLPLLPHIARLCFHCTYSQWTIVRSSICNLTQLKTLELNIDIMLDEEERDGHDWDDEGEGGSIGELTKLLSLERLHFALWNSTELSTFLGPLMRTKLKELYVQSYQASELIPLLNLMPNLKILEIGTCDELESLYPLVTTIEKLTLNYSIRLLQHFQDMQNDLSFKDNKSFQLAHLTIRGQRKIVNFSILSHIPATVSVLILEFDSKNSLAGALESLMEGQIQFKKLQVKLVTFDRSESDDEDEEPLVDNVEFDLNSEWERVIVECKRFGVAVERIL